MSTALVKHTPTAAVVVESAAPSFAEMMQMGDALARTGFLPDHIKNGAQAAAIILAGRELGMPPMRALRSITLVKGKVTESADSQLARFKTDGGRATFRQLDETSAVLWLRHPNGDEHVESFTMDDAKKAQLTGSGMYGKFPKAMLRSRAITAGLKSIGWEGGAGAYDPDELAPMTPASEPEAALEVRSDPRVSEPRVDVTRMTLLQAEDYVLKGRRFGEMDDARLAAVAAWAAEKGNVVFQTAAEIVLGSRQDASATEEAA